MRNHKLEQAVGTVLREGLAANAPDVWPEVAARVRAAGSSGSGEPCAARPKRRLLKVCAAAAAAVVCAAGVWKLSGVLPAVEARAETVYDGGGRLSGDTAEAPSQSFTEAYNTFGLNLLRQTVGENASKNVFQSPASVYLALGMTYNGAKGETASEFARVLGGTGGLDGFNKGCAGLQGLLTGKFRLANSIWLNSPYAGAIDKSFLARDKTYFGASVTTLDLSSAAAPKLISGWVEKNTDGRIHPKFQSFDASTVMLLVNTVTFRSDWEQKFQAANTQTGTFQTPSGAENAEFMHGMRAHYAEDETAQKILLPYDDGKTSLLVLLPKGELNGMLSGLTAQRLAAYTAECKNSRETAALSLPRVRFGTDAMLNGPLQAMGLRSAFGENADFSGMTSGGDSPYLSYVRHMTYLAIDENGTEAAAATAAAIDSSGSRPDHVMKVNRPFFAAIVNTETGAALFEGVVNDPSVSG